VLLLLALVVFVFYSARFSKKIIFGVGFFGATVFLVLQLLPVGGAIMADRYSYIPSIGIFYLAGEGFHWLWNRKRKLIAVAALCTFTIFFTVKTRAQCSVWKNDMTLWNDVIRQYQNVPFAYYNRGLAHIDEENYDMALADFNKTIEMSDKYISAYLNRAKILYGKRQLVDALKDYNKVIELRPNAAEAYFNRGNLLMDSKRSDEGIQSFSKAIELDPGFVQVYLNRGIAFYRAKQYETAINDFSKAIELRGDFAEAYYMKGKSEYNLDRREAACADLQRSLDIGYQPAADAMLELCR
jgi:tetratricopeptide (TPR) repeat protein